jgi:glutathione S-transferase
MLLHFLPGSPFARMARISLRELRLDFQESMIETFPPPDDFFRLNPLGQVPVLEDGGHAYFPTMPVLTRIFRRAGQDAGRNHDFADTLARKGSDEADLQILEVLLSFSDFVATTQYIKWSDMHPGPRNRLGFQTVDRNTDRIHNTLDWLEHQVSGDGFWPGIVSAQDVVLACILLWTDSRGPIDWRGRPGLERIVAKLRDRQSFRETEPPPLDDSWKD